MVREETGTVCTEEEDFVKYDVFCKLVFLITWKRTLYIKLLLLR